MNYRCLILLLSLGVTLAYVGAAAESWPSGLAVGQTAKGAALVDARGRTLYVFDQDKGGSPACYDKCAELWPPVIAEPAGAAVTGFSVVARKDGKLQLSYKGQPLYTWHKDAAAGDADGDGFRDLWHIAKP